MSNPSSGAESAGRLERKDADLLVRGWNLLYNRCLSYSFSHPLVQESLPRVWGTFQEALRRSPNGLNFMLQEAMFYLDGVDVMYQPNNRRISDHLRRFGMESISLQPGFTEQDFYVFIDACSLTHPDPEAFLRYYQGHGGLRLDVNQVSLRAVREGDVVGHQSSFGGGNSSGDFQPSGAGDRFEDIVLRAMVGRLSAQELENNVALAQLLSDPQALGKAAIEGTAGAAPQARAAGMNQMVLNVLSHFSTGQARENFSVEELLEGIFSMRSEMLRMVKAQQNLDAGLANEEVEAATDGAFEQTVCQIIVEEYKTSRGNLKRVSHVLGRVVTGKKELRRILPRLKDSLIAVGCSLHEWYGLVSELSASLHGDKAIEELSEAAAEFGVTGDEILQELRRDPKGAARLLLVAAEIRASGAELNSEAAVQAMLDALENTGEKLAERAAENPTEAVDLARMMGNLEGQVREDLAQRNLAPEVRKTVERKVGLRVQRAMGELKARAMVAHLRDPSGNPELQAGVLAELAKDEAEVDGVMGMALSMLGPDEVAQNVARQVAEKVKQRLRDERERAASRELPQSVYPKAVAEFFLRYETRRCTRYGVPFSAMLVSFQGLPEDQASLDAQGPSLRGLFHVLTGDIRTVLRDVDFVGSLGYNRLLVILPMTISDNAEFVARKVREKFSREVALPDGTRSWVRTRVGVASFDRQDNAGIREVMARLTVKWQEDL